MFLQNGQCGYVLRPRCQFSDDFDPTDISTVNAHERKTILIKVNSNHIRLPTIDLLLSIYFLTEFLNSFKLNF